MGSDEVQRAASIFDVVVPEDYEQRDSPTSNSPTLSFCATSTDLHLDGADVGDDEVHLHLDGADVGDDDVHDDASIAHCGLALSDAPAQEHNIPPPRSNLDIARPIGRIAFEPELT